MATLSAGQHHVIRDAQESVGQLLLDVFKEQGYKRVHLVVEAPSSDAIEGKLPGISVYHYNMTLDEDGVAANRSGIYYDQVVGADGRVREVERDLPIWLRLDYLISAWAQTPEEEQLILGAAIKGLVENPTINGTQLKGTSWEPDSYLPLVMSRKLDEGILSRFWASINQPMKPAIQCWTTVPIYPSKEVEIRRVQREGRAFLRPQQAE